MHTMSRPRRSVVATAFHSLVWVMAAVATGVHPPLRAAAPHKDNPDGSRPNILLILADDLGYGDVGCYNPASKVPTPHLDRLAREGMRFTDAHSPSTVCTPTRYSLLTGRMAFRTGYRGVFVGVGGPCLIEPGRLTLPQMLRDQGYATALIGKWHVGLTFLDRDGNRITRGGVEGVELIDHTRPIPDAPVHRGFDRFFGTACCPTTDFLYAYIDGDRIPVPPETPLDKTRLPQHAYSRDNRPGLVAPDFDLERVDQVFLEKSREFLAAHVRRSPDQPFFLLHSAQAVHLPSFPADEFKGRTDAGPHSDFIFEFDHIVGELLGTLERLGVADNTLVIVTSDNGPETTSVIHMRADHAHDGARPWRGMKRDQWEGGHRVPFIARWPGRIPAASESDETICLTDVMATCAAFAGATLPDDAAEDSFDVSGVLLGRTNGAPVREFTLHQTISLALAIRQGPWKYLDHRGSGGNNYGRGELQSFALPDTAPGAPGQLYNLAHDPGETRNLYFAHPEIAADLKARLEGAKASGRTAPLRRPSPTAAITAPGGPLKVFVLAGQSNMEGQGMIAADPKRNGGQGSLEFLVGNPATAAVFAHLRDPAGDWRVRDDVWVHYLDRKGPLTVGYGARSDRIGPELGFGNVVGDRLGERVLLIKLAWGGKSLAVDFRPPGAGGETGPFYRTLIGETKRLLADPGAEFPELRGAQAELVGFGWHQGWNDRVNQQFNDAYETNLAHFIRDVRRDLGAPGLPFVIAETGMSGHAETHPRALSLMRAQAAVAAYPEFARNVGFVGTKDFFRAKEISPSGQAYHWNSNAETYYLIGDGMGRAMLELLDLPRSKPALTRPAPDA